MSETRIRFKAILTSIIFVFSLIISSINVCAYESTGITVSVDGRQIEFDVKPQIIEGRTMVPIRGIFEAMGADVLWDESSNTVIAKKDDKVVKMTLESRNSYVNEETVTMDVPPVIVNGRILAPARYVAEGFGYAVSWNSTSKTVVISSDEDARITVHYIDVGQADAILLISAGQKMLIDGGNVSDSSLIYAYLSKLNIDYLDYIIATHAHEDHMGGLSGALSKASVGLIYTTQKESDAKFYKNFVRLAQEKGVEIKHPESGQTFSLGNATVELIVPKNVDENNMNNTSIMTKVVCGNTSFLFTGDAEYEEELDVLNQNVDLNATVLKAGHHGSETSSSYVFLREVMPKYVIVSVGKDNSYGHPDESAMSRFRDVGATVYRTDVLGDIVVKSNGEKIFIATQKSDYSDKVPIGQTVYVTPTGKRYHYSISCAGKNGIAKTLDEAQSMGLTACQKCSN